MDFKIQGANDVFDEPTFWSNDDGWVDFESATTFHDDDLKRCFHFPIETSQVVVLDERGKITAIMSMDQIRSTDFSQY